MLPKWHIFIGFLFTIILKFTTPIDYTNLLIIFLASFLIDVDHWFVYVLKKKDFSISKAYNWFIQKGIKYEKLSLKERKKYKKLIMIFHGIEFWILLLVLSVYSKIFIFILLGIAIHMVFDFMEIINKKEPLYTKFSQIYSCIKNKNKKAFY